MRALVAARNVGVVGHPNPDDIEGDEMATLINRYPHAQEQRGRTTAEPGRDLRERLLAGLPVRERRLDLAGVSTAVLEGGDGPPIVLLHGPGEFAAKWMRVFPALVRTNRVIAPDLPGHGTSE